MTYTDTQTEEVCEQCESLYYLFENQCFEG